MHEMVIKILVELLGTLALVTKQLKQGKTSEPTFGEVLCYLTRSNAEKIVKKLFGEKDVEAILQRLDRLTGEEARTTAAETLEVVYCLIQNMKVVLDCEQNTFNTFGLSPADC